MSLLTRCPACTTLYKVVPDQLRISQGWVKCGQCSEIFDATQHLMEASTEPEEPVPNQASESVSTTTEDDVREEQRQVGEGLPPAATPLEGLSNSEPDPEVRPVPDQDASLGNADIAETVEQIEDRELDQDGSTCPSDGSEVSPQELIEPGPLVADAGPESVPEAQAEPDADKLVANEDTADLTLSFMRHANQPAIGFRRWGDRVLLGLGVLLVVGLAGQWLYQDHDRLAASRPQWRPALDKICAVLRCSVAPLQQIESIAIDSAVFSKGERGLYRLSFILKNTASLMLALPSIELTLTDVQDRVVVRRVIAPHELAVASDQLAANAEWPVMVNLRLQNEASSTSVVGYRLLAFYP